MKRLLNPGTHVHYWLIDEIGIISKYIKSENLYLVDFKDGTSLFLHEDSLEEIES